MSLVITHVPLNRWLLAIGLVLLTSVASAQPKGLWFGLAQQQQRVLAVGERGQLAWSDNFGQDWHELSIGTSASLTAVCATPTQLWVASQSGELWGSEDRGLHWNAKITATHSPLFALDCWQDQVIAVGAYGSFVYATASTPAEARILTELDDADLGSPHLYAVLHQDKRWLVAGEAGLVAESSNQGKTWQSIATPYQGSFFTLAADGTELWVAGLKGHVYSKSARTTWTALKPSPQTSIFSLKIIQHQLLMAGNSGQVWWAKQELTPRYPGVITDLLLRDNTLLMTGDQGISRWELP